MKQSVCRVMMGVAGFAVLGTTATLAAAQTVEVKEKPPLYRYVSYWTLPRAHWGDVDKDNATGNQKILAPSLADGTLVGYGDDENQVHSAEGFTSDNWWQANSIAGLMKVLEAFYKGGGGARRCSSARPSTGIRYTSAASTTGKPGPGKAHTGTRVLTSSNPMRPTLRMPCGRSASFTCRRSRRCSPTA